MGKGRNQRCVSRDAGSRLGGIEEGADYELWRRSRGYSRHGPVKIRRKMHLLVMTYKALGAGLLFSAQILLARLLSTEEYGVVAYALAWVGVLVLFAKIGMDNTAIRFVAVYSNQGRWDLLWGIVIVAVLSPLLLGAVICAAVWGLPVEELPGSGQYGRMVPWVLLLALLLAQQNIATSFLRGRGRVAAAEVLENVVRPGILLAFFGVAWFMSWPMHAEKALLQYIVVTSTVVISAFAWLAVLGLPQVKVVRPKFRWREWLATSVALWISGGVYFLNSRIDTLMLGMFREAKEVALYAVASRITDLLGFGVAAVTAIVAPKVAALHGAGADRELMQAALDDGGRFLAWTVFGGAAALSLLGPALLGLFGDAYVSAYPALLVLVLGRVVEGATGPAGYVLAMTGNHWIGSAVMAAALVLNLTLNAALIPLWGAMGAAVATAASLTVWNVLIANICMRRLRVNPTIVARLTHREEI